MILLLLNLLLTTVDKYLYGQMQKMVLAFHILTCQAFVSGYTCSIVIIALFGLLRIY